MSCIHTSFLGVAQVAPNQIDDYIRSVNPDAPALGQIYVNMGRKFQLRADLAAAQMIHETGFLRFGGQVRPEQHNPAGLKGFDGRFLSFPGWYEGIHAHYERLQCYVRPEDITGEGGLYDPTYGHWRYWRLKEKWDDPSQLVAVASLWSTGDPYGYANAVCKYLTGILVVPPAAPPGRAAGPAPVLLILALLGGMGYGVYRLIRHLLGR